MWGWLFVLLSLFLLLLVLGAFIDSMAYSLSTVNRASGQPCLLFALLMKTLTWTWSNVFLLACLASLIGHLGRAASSSRVIPNYPYALMGGFGVFLGALMTQFALVAHIPVQVSQSAYLHIAGMVSFAAFFVGLYPAHLPQLLQRVLSAKNALLGNNSPTSGPPNP